MIKLILCSYCKHLKSIENKCIFICDAFPEGVPIEFDGDVKNCNNDIHFEKKEGIEMPYDV